jgi:hypothetical protein
MQLITSELESLGLRMTAAEADIADIMLRVTVLEIRNQREEVRSRPTQLASTPIMSCARCCEG